MINKIGAFLLFSFVSIVSAQKGTLSIEYSLGAAVPLGDFGDANSQNSSSGYAKTGFSSQIGIKYQLNDGGFNVLLSTQSQANAFDVTAYDREITLLDPRLNWSISADVYSMSAFLAGFQQDFIVSDRIKIGVIAQLGFGAARDPMLSLMEFNTGYWSISANNYSSSLVYKFGGQAKVELPNNFYITLAANYIAADFDFKSTEVYNSLGDYETYSYSKKFNSFNFQLGLGAYLFKLNRI